MTDAPRVTDTPKSGQPRPYGMDLFKIVVGDLARPCAIHIMAGATAVAVVVNSISVDKLNAAGLILATLYGAKAIEVGVQATQTARIEKAKAENTPPPVLVIPTTDIEGGELRPEDQIP